MKSQTNTQNSLNNQQVVHPVQHKPNEASDRSKINTFYCSRFCIQQNDKTNIATWNLIKTGIFGELAYYAAGFFLGY